MRALINTFSALGPRTGIGHYTTELVRCLLQQAGDGEIDLFPRGWARQAALVWARLRRNIVRQAGPEACPTAPAGRPGWREHLLSRVREHGLALLRRSFERECGRRRYDV